MPYKSEAQRRFLHARHPEIAAKWDAEIRGKKKRTISKARRDYAPGPLESRRMDDEELARAKNRQKYFSLTGSGLGLTGLSLLGAGASIKRTHPVRATQLKNLATNTSIGAGGVGALSGINFARIQGEESKRTREIKKSNYGAGYSQYYSDPIAVEGVPVRTKVSTKKTPYTISHRAADPERSRERRALVYPVAMGAGAVGSGALAVQQAGKAQKQSKFFDKKILNSKTLRVGIPVAAAGALAAGAGYNAKGENRRSYEGKGWYPQKERSISKSVPSFLRHGSPEKVDRLLQTSPATAARYAAWESGKQATGFLGQRKGALLRRSDSTADVGLALGLSSINRGKEARTLSRALPTHAPETGPVPLRNVANRRAVARGDARYRRSSRRSIV